MPLFADVLELVNGQVPLIVELKCKNRKSLVCEMADSLLKDYKGIYCIESFNPAVLLWYRLNRPEVCRGQLSSNFPKHDGNKTLAHYAMRHLLTNFLTAPDFIAYNCQDKKALSLNLCRAVFGCPAVAWTIRSQDELSSCRDYFDYFIFEALSRTRRIEKIAENNGEPRYIGSPLFSVRCRIPMVGCKRRMQSPAFV